MRCPGQHNCHRHSSDQQTVTTEGDSFPSFFLHVVPCHFLSKWRGRSCVGGGAYLPVRPTQVAVRPGSILLSCFDHLLLLLLSPLPGCGRGLAHFLWK